MAQRNPGGRWSSLRSDEMEQPLGMCGVMCGSVEVWRCGCVGGCVGGCDALYSVPWTGVEHCVSVTAWSPSMV